MGTSATSLAAYAARFGRALGFALAVGLVGCATGSSAGEESAATSTDTTPMKVERGPLAGRLLLSGEVVAESSAVAAAPVVRIWPLQVRWIAEDGSRVEGGQRVLELDNGQLTSRLEDLRTRVVEQGSKLDEVTARAAADESAALLDLERSRAALRKAEIRAEVPEGILAAKELADRQKELAAARFDVQAGETAHAAKREGGRALVADARLTLVQAQRELATTEESLERLVVRAPRAGILLIEDGQEARPIREGDQVWPGMTVARIPDLSTLVVRALLYDVDDGRVATGTQVRAFLDAFPGRPFPGTVRGIESIAQPVTARSLRRAFQVTVDLDGGEREQMRPGMSVRVEVPMAAGEALSVPRRALGWDGAAPYVRLAAGGRVKVRLGACSTTRCALNGGVREGTLLAPPNDDDDDA